MKPKKKRIIRSLDLEELSATRTPAVTLALHAITKSDIREPITGPIVLTGEQRRLANEWAEQLLKSQKIEKEQKMTAPKSTADIVKAYQDRHDVSYQEAFAKVSTRPEFAAAYEAENQQGHIARMVAERDKVYPHG